MWNVIETPLQTATTPPQTSTTQQEKSAPDSAKKKSIRATQRENGINYKQARKIVLGIQSADRGGPPTRFTDGEEKSVEDMLVAAADIGFPINRSLLMKVTFEVGKSKGVSFIFIFIILIDGLMLWFSLGLSDERATLSVSWHKGFMRRHPELSRRVTEGNKRHKIHDWNEECCEEWIARHLCVA